MCRRIIPPISGARRPFIRGQGFFIRESESAGAGGPELISDFTSRDAAAGGDGAGDSGGSAAESIVNNPFLPSLWLPDFHGGGPYGRAAWAHNPAFRGGVPYPQWSRWTIWGSGANFRNAATQRRSGAIQYVTIEFAHMNEAHPNNHSAFGGVSNGSRARVQSDHGILEHGLRQNRAGVSRRRRRFRGGGAQEAAAEAGGDNVMKTLSTVSGRFDAFRTGENVRHPGCSRARPSSPRPRRTTSPHWTRSSALTARRSLLRAIPSRTPRSAPSSPAWPARNIRSRRIPMNPIA